MSKAKRSPGKRSMSIHQKRLRFFFVAGLLAAIAVMVFLLWLLSRPNMVH